MTPPQILSGHPSSLFTSFIFSRPVGVGCPTQAPLLSKVPPRMYVRVFLQGNCHPQTPRFSVFRFRRRLWSALPSAASPPSFYFFPYPPMKNPNSGMSVKFTCLQLSLGFDNPIALGPPPPPPPSFFPRVHYLFLISSPLQNGGLPVFPRRPAPTHRQDFVFSVRLKKGIVAMELCPFPVSPPPELF